MAKRNHHKQPNFYLKGFKSSDEGNPKVWVYEKGKPFFEGKNEKLQNPKHLTTEKAARQKDFYAFEKEDGTKEYDKYEDLLRDKFEEPAKPIIEKIRKFEEIDENEMQIFLRYVASMKVRGDWWKKVDDEIDKFLIPDTEKKLYQIAEIAGGNRPFIVNQMYSVFKSRLDEESKIRKKGEYDKISMLKHIEKMCNELLVNLQIKFLISSPSMQFLTSDNPVCYTDFQQIDVNLYFPISSEICLFATRIKNADKKWEKYNSQFWLVNDKTVEYARDFIVKESVKQIYSSQKAEWLVKFINNRNIK